MAGDVGPLGTGEQVRDVLVGEGASLTVFGTIQNLCTITRYDGIDPEVYGGIDGTMYPRPRTFVGGVKFNF